LKIPLSPAIAIAGVAIIGATLAGAWWWWQQNAERLKESARASYAEGRRAGAALTESGCLAAAFERHRDPQNQAFAESIRTNLILRGCLDVSRVEAAFCEGVPAKDNVVTLGAWAAQRCISLNFADSYCSQILTQVAKHCASPERALKLRQS